MEGMIDFITGVVVNSSATGEVVLDCGPFGVEVVLPTRELELVEVGVRLRVYSIVRISVESGAIRAIGSVSRDDRDSMAALLEIPGIGPKVVLSMFSKLGGDGVRQALGAEDVQVLSSVPGLGAKSAGKLIISCKGKGFPLAPKEGAEVVSRPVASGVASLESDAQRSVVSGLIGLGWKEAEAVAKVIAVSEECDKSDAGAIMRLALKTG